jgi:hypothetical protein
MYYLFFKVHLLLFKITNNYLQIDKKNDSDFY